MVQTRSTHVDHAVAVNDKDNDASSAATTITIATKEIEVATKEVVSESPATKKLRRGNELSIKHKLVKELFLERAKKGTIVKGLIGMLVNKYKKAGHPYITEPSIKHYMKRLKDKPICDISTEPPIIEEPVTVQEVVPVVSVDVLDLNNDSQMSSISPDGNSSNRNKGGRPLGSSEELKAANLKAKDEATTECAMLYKDMQEQAKASGKRNGSRGSLKKLIKETEDKYGLLNGTIKSETISKRVYRNNLTGYKYQSTSPVAQMEPVLCDYCIRLCKIGKALDKKQVMLLANSLITRSGWENQVIDWKKSQGMYDPDKPLLGKKWYHAFLKRYKHKIRRGRCKIQDVNRKSWCTYDHFEAMYMDVYETMVKAGVAGRLDEAVWLNKEGCIVAEDDAEKFGRKTRYMMEHPEWCLFADETGCNTNQKEDGYRGGQLFVLENGCEEGGLTGVVTDIHFTVMCFTCATGDPVLCVVIMKSEMTIAEVPISWKWGIDITKSANQDGKCNAELFEDNCGKEKIISGGPVCTFQGKEIPCFVGSSKKASITSQMLADILTYMDELELFDRSTGKKPFLLVDGHHSRFGLPFLDYIFNDDHPWMVSIGVPYGTHIWQVADSSEQNAIFKKLLSEEKAMYLEYRPVTKQKFAPTDVIPLVKKCWDRSFGHCFNSRKAIASRGWNPLTYNLLDNKRLERSKKQQPNVEVPPTSLDDAVDPLSLNTSAGIAGTYTDIIIDHTMRDAARMEGSRIKRLAKEANYAGCEQIGKAVAMRSGLMATDGNFTFTIAHRDTAKRKFETKDLELNEKKEKKAATTKKLTTALDNAIEKHILGEELSSDNYRALLKHHYVRGNDSPLQKTKPALKEQWIRRKIKYNVRYGDNNYYATANENENNLPQKNGAPSTIDDANNSLTLERTARLNNIVTQAEPVALMDHNDDNNDDINESAKADLNFMAEFDAEFCDDQRQNNLFSM